MMMMRIAYVIFICIIALIACKHIKRKLGKWKDLLKRDVVCIFRPNLMDNACLRAKDNWSTAVEPGFVRDHT